MTSRVEQIHSFAQPETEGFLIGEVTASSEANLKHPSVIQGAANKKLKLIQQKEDVARTESA